jgi:hypothetical protein
MAHTGHCEDVAMELMSHRTNEELKWQIMLAAKNNLMTCWEQ